MTTNPIQLVRLDLLMDRSRGSPEVIVGLIDGPVALNHPDLTASKISVAGKAAGSCSLSGSIACQHGTFVAGILAARRGSPAPAICPDCTLMLRPIFPENDAGNGEMPNATPQELANAIQEVVESGARVINLSAALLHPTRAGLDRLQRALDFAATRGVITVAAAGNQGTVGSSAITGHPGVIPVVACNQLGQPTTESNLGRSIGRRGLAAPGENITSLGTSGRTGTFHGTSAAAPFVTGAVALLWSEFPHASATHVRLALTQLGKRSRTTIAPPMLDAWAAYEVMANAPGRSRAISALVT